MKALREPPAPRICPVNYDTLCAIAARFIGWESTRPGDGWYVNVDLDRERRDIVLAGTSRVWQDADGSIKGSLVSARLYVGTVMNIISFHYVGDEPYYAKNEESSNPLLYDATGVVTPMTVLLVAPLTRMAVDHADGNIRSGT